jgi:glycerophosphoryl diester phosphodiesterase
MLGLYRGFNASVNDALAESCRNAPLPLIEGKSALRQKQIPNPQLVAHRGYPEHYPENTIIGIEAAVRAGARFVEVDVQLSADEVPVLLHDRTLDRVCGVRGTVPQMSYEQLRVLHPKEYERFGYRFAQVHIATLAELVEYLRGHTGVTAFVELKRSSIKHFGPTVMLNRVLREVEPILNRIVLISFSFEVLLAARKQDVPSVGAILETWSARRDSAVRELRPDYVICDVAALPVWGTLRTDNARLMVYEVTDAALAMKLTRRGVQLVETFAVGEMLDDLELLRGAESTRR